MDDIIFFSKQIIMNEDVKRYAIDIGAIRVFISESYDDLAIYYSKNHKVDWYKMSIDEFGDPCDADYLLQNEIKSIYLISHHKKDLPFIINHIKLLMRDFGGWLGNDSDMFQPCFNIDNIEKFSYE